MGREAALADITVVMGEQQGAAGVKLTHLAQGELCEQVCIMDWRVMQAGDENGDEKAWAMREGRKPNW